MDTLQELRQVKSMGCGLPDVQYCLLIGMKLFSCELQVAEVLVLLAAL